VPVTDAHARGTVLVDGAVEGGCGDSGGFAVPLDAGTPVQPTIPIATREMNEACIVTP
jgi:hypothetical protein